MILDSLRVAALQMISGQDVESNVDAACDLINRAVREDQAKLLVLPENFLCFSAAKYGLVAQEANCYIDVFCDMAKSLDVHIVLGSLPLATRPDGAHIEGRVRSACLVIDSNGCVAARYDKMHLFDVDVADGQGAYRESNEFEPGDFPQLAQVGQYNLGLSICYDLRFPGLYQVLRQMGAHVLLVPAAFTEVTGEAHWETLLRSRAIENQCYVIAANQGGRHSEKRHTWGHSMIVDPWGEILASLKQGEGYCAASLELGRLNQIRRDMPILGHRREYDSANPS